MQNALSAMSQLFALGGVHIPGPSDFPMVEGRFEWGLCARCRRICGEAWMPLALWKGSGVSHEYLSHVLKTRVSEGW